MRPLSRDIAQTHADGIDAERYWWTDTLAERKRLLAEAQTDEERRVGEGIVAIAEAQLRHIDWKLRAYEALARGEEVPGA